MEIDFLVTVISSNKERTRTNMTYIHADHVTFVTKRGGGGRKGWLYEAGVREEVDY